MVTANDIGKCVEVVPDAADGKPVDGWVIDEFRNLGEGLLKIVTVHHPSQPNRLVLLTDQDIVRVYDCTNDVEMSAGRKRRSRKTRKSRRKIQ